MNGALADEFSLVLTELRVGESSERALKRMAKRLDTPEVTSFVRSLLQGEQLGLSLGQTLRNLADDSRRRRRSLAEEAAAKAPIKMLFPAALFIFPALFIVILGPADPGAREVPVSQSAPTRAVRRRSGARSSSSCS